MRRYGILLLMLVLATASLLAAAAYNTATVTNAASLRIVNTEDALLSLVPSKGSGNRDATVTIDDKGRLVFEFARGRGGKSFGVQPNSVYQWDHLFKVVNNTSESLDVTVEVTGELRQQVEVKIEGADEFSGPEDTRDLGPGSEKHVSVRITCEDGVSFGNPSDVMRIKAQSKRVSR